MYPIQLRPAACGSGKAAEQGAGKYAINVNLSMSSIRKLKVYIRKEGLDYSEEIGMLIL